MIKSIPKKKKCKKAKWLSGEALQTAEKRSESQRSKGKIYPTECSIPKNSKERRQESLAKGIVQRNRFKGLDLIDRVPDELRTEVCDIVQESEYQGLKAI